MPGEQNPGSPGKHESAKKSVEAALQPLKELAAKHGVTFDQILRDLASYPETCEQFKYVQTNFLAFLHTISHEPNVRSRVDYWLTVQRATSPTANGLPDIVWELFSQAAKGREIDQYVGNEVKVEPTTWESKIKRASNRQKLLELFPAQGTPEAQKPFSQKWTLERVQTMVDGSNTYFDSLLREEQYQKAKDFVQDAKFITQEHGLREKWRELASADLHFHQLSARLKPQIENDLPIESIQRFISDYTDRIQNSTVRESVNTRLQELVRQAEARRNDVTQEVQELLKNEYPDCEALVTALAEIVLRKPKAIVRLEGKHSELSIDVSEMRELKEQLHSSYSPYIENRFYIPTFLEQTKARITRIAGLRETWLKTARQEVVAIVREELSRATAEKKTISPLILEEMSKHGGVAYTALDRQETPGATERPPKTVETPWGPSVILTDGALSDKPKNQDGGKILVQTKGEQPTQTTVDIVNMLVVDGMGGTKNGDLAKDIGVSALSSPMSGDAYFAAAQEAVRQRSSELGDGGFCHSHVQIKQTETGQYLAEVSHTGDVRTVVYRNGRVVFETDDDYGYVDNGQVITSAVTAQIIYGQRLPVETVLLEPGDVILSFSDGVADNLLLRDEANKPRTRKRGAHPNRHPISFFATEAADDIEDLNHKLIWEHLNQPRLNQGIFDLGEVVSARMRNGGKKDNITIAAFRLDTESLKGITPTTSGGNAA